MLRRVRGIPAASYRARASSIEREYLLSSLVAVCRDRSVLVADSCRGSSSFILSMIARGELTLVVVPIPRRARRVGERQIDFRRSPPADVRAELRRGEGGSRLIEPRR